MLMKISDKTGAIMTLASINDGKASEVEADFYALSFTRTYAYICEVPLETPMESSPTKRRCHATSWSPKRHNLTCRGAWPVSEEGRPEQVARSS